MQQDLGFIAKQFQLNGSLVEVKPFGSGHINDTFLLTCQTDKVQVRYILQRINRKIFIDPPALMENYLRVTEHIKKKVLAQGNTKLAERMVSVVSAIDGAVCYKSPEGNYWRLCTFVENAYTCDTMETPEQAYEAARMFGWFQRMLADLPGEPLHETIPDFHNTPERYLAFEKVLAEDVCGRAKDVKAEIDFAIGHADMCGVLLDLADAGEIPVRVTHNDTKINNVMLDDETGKGVCVIDLDTVMSGISLYDFGDMVRTATSFSEEDEKDLSLVNMRMPMFEALVGGFIRGTSGLLTDTEKQHLVFAGKLIIFEQYIRFLGDYIQGDVYYKIHRPGHNLDRSRTQLKLIQSIIEQEDEMNALVDSLCRGV